MFNIFKRNKKEIKTTEVEEHDEPVVIYDNCDDITFDFNKVIINEAATYLKDLNKCKKIKHNIVLVGETGMLYLYDNDGWYCIGMPIQNNDLSDESFTDVYVSRAIDLKYVKKEPNLIVKVCEINQFFICKDDNWKLLGKITN